MSLNFFSDGTVGRFGGRALPGPAGVKRSPRPLAAIRGLTSKGRGREGKGREGRGGEGKEKGGRRGRGGGTCSKVLGGIDAHAWRKVMAVIPPGLWLQSPAG